MNKSNRKLLPAMATVVVVLLVMCGIGSAGYIAITKDTAASDPALYWVGDTITYNMTVAIHGEDVTPPANYWFKVDVYDTYPNGTVELLESDLELFYNGTKSKQYVRTYVVSEPDINTSWILPGHWVINYVTTSGIDNIQGAPGTGIVDASTDCPSKIAREPLANFDFDAGDCDLIVQFTPNANDPDGTIALYEWDFENDGTIDKTTTSASLFSHTFPASGDHGVKLTVTDNDDLTDWIVKTVHITAPPTVTVKRSPPAPQCVEIGDSVTFSIASLTNDAPMATYEWTFTNGIAGSGVLPWPSDGDVSITRTIPSQYGTKATLTVVDELGCEGEDDVTVCVDPPEEVPLLTLPGMFALIGMMCIVGAGRILTRGRRS